MKTRAEVNELENRKIIKNNKIIEFIVPSNATKKLVFWKHHKIDKSLARWKKKKEKSQINSIMNEPGNVMTDPIEE